MIVIGCVIVNGIVHLIHLASVMLNIDSSPSLVAFAAHMIR